MKSFFSDLWTELREKRLWPLAVVLLAGLVAVPLVLKKSVEEPPPAKPVALEARSAPEPRELKGLATVKLEEGEFEDGSSLDAFDPSDPFRPPARVVKRSEEEAGAGSPVTEDVTVSEGTVETGGGGGDTGATSGGGTGGGGTGGGGSGTGGGDTGEGGTGDSGDGGGTQTETVEYAYVIDVTFVANGRRRTIKGMERLDMLPNEASPLLLFLGVSSNAGNAVFLVDSTLQSAGEGRCKPSPDECAFLYLGAGSEHMFTNEDGDAYRLRIDQIRKVRVDERASASASPGGRRAGAALAAPRPRRRFASPLISDLVSVSSSGAGDSNGSGDRR